MMKDVTPGQARANIERAKELRGQVILHGKPYAISTDDDISNAEKLLEQNQPGSAYDCAERACNDLKDRLPNIFKTRSKRLDHDRRQNYDR